MSTSNSLCTITYQDYSVHVQGIIAMSSSHSFVELMFSEINEIMFLHDPIASFD